MSSEPLSGHLAVDIQTAPPGAADIPAASRPAKPGAALAGLVWTLVRTDFKARYHGTLSGFAWALLKPLTMFAVLVAVFSVIFGAERTYKLDLVIGLFLWDFFAEGTKVGLTSLHARGYLLAKARFPSWILVVTSISNPLLTVAVFAVALTAFLASTSAVPSTAHLLLFASYIAALGAIVVGFSLAASVLFLRFRDLNQVWEVVTQAGFFVAPIVYPVGVIPERFHFYLYAWPPTAAIEFSRAVLIDGRPPTPLAHAYFAAVAAAVLALGALVYSWRAPRAAEYV
ncbi:MAG TPA: ABC transporter permease [Vicinamibacterales bacterium]|nr:ABC transporter permease [Vicinamibacterales bacterium]